MTFIGVNDLEIADGFFGQIGLVKVATQHRDGAPMVYIYRCEFDIDLTPIMYIHYISMN